MNDLVIIFALATFVSTICGGLVIIKFKKYLPYFFAFAAGSLIAVSFFDLLPESLQISQNIGFPIKYIMLAVVASFFFYSLVERFFLTHHIEKEDTHGHIMGPVGAGSLIIHSLLDGVAIGSAFYANVSVGIIVAFAVIFHDFTDGINTVTLMLKNKHKTRKAALFLFLDALAPVVGILLTNIIVLPQVALALLLAIFVGEFLYIGASTLLPETMEHNSKGVIIAMALAIIMILVLTSII
ncbi:MAG: ZIP family metal transporter [Candidatus Pacearchaeota archaeon]|nr:ZIP family metal transporter [Candidatus Pacearchaeota archaeon]